MGPRAHGDVDTLGTITCSLQSQQGGGAWIHRYVVVFGMGAIRSAYNCFPWLGVKRNTAVTSDRKQEGVRICTQGKERLSWVYCAAIRRTLGRTTKKAEEETGRNEVCGSLPASMIPWSLLITCDKSLVESIHEAF